MRGYLFDAPGFGSEFFQDMTTTLAVILRPDPNATGTINY